MSKFSYEEGELLIADNQCQLCKFYNNGLRSEICPKDKLQAIEDNLIACPCQKINNLIDLDDDDDDELV